MQITNSNSLNGMLAAQAQVTQTASNLAQVANITGDPATQEVTADFINSIVNQIPQVISKFSLTLTTQREIQFSPKTWDDLYKLSLETFVDESEEKRISGAGAGLTDND